MSSYTVAHAADIAEVAPDLDLDAGFFALVWPEHVRGPVRYVGDAAIHGPYETREAAIANHDGAEVTAVLA